MAPNDVADEDGADDVGEHLLDHQVAQIGVQQSRQSAEAQVVAEQFRRLRRCAGCAGTLPVQLFELGQGEGEYLQRHVAPGDVGDEFRREHLRIGARDHHLGAFLTVQGGHGALPARNLLHLVDDHHPRLVAPGAGLHQVDEVARRAHLVELERLHVDVYDLALVAQRGRELAQQHALADAPQARDRGDDRGIEESAESGVVVLSTDFYHSSTISET